MKSVSLDFEPLENEIVHIEPTFEVRGLSDCEIIIRELGEFLVILSNGEEISRTSNTTFRALIFDDVSTCKIELETKVLKVLFINTTSSSIRIHCSSIGPVEFYSCKDTIVWVEKSLPFLYIEKCNEMSIMQKEEEMVYIVKLCIGVKCITVDETTGNVTSSKDIGKLFWDPHEMNVIISSKRGDIQISQLQYHLNNIGHNFISLDV